MSCIFHGLASSQNSISCEKSGDQGSDGLTGMGWGGLRWVGIGQNELGGAISYQRGMGYNGLGWPAVGCDGLRWANSYNRTTGYREW